MLGLPLRFELLDKHGKAPGERRRDSVVLAL